MVTPLVLVLKPFANFTENTQSPSEIKRREVSWTLRKKLAQKRSRAGRWCWARERVGLLSPQLFPNGGATDIVFMTLFCIAVGTAIAWLAAVHGSLGLPGWRLF